MPLIVRALASRLGALSSKMGDRLNRAIKGTASKHPEVKKAPVYKADGTVDEKKFSQWLSEYARKNPGKATLISQGVLYGTFSGAEAMIGKIMEDDEYIEATARLLASIPGDSVSARDMDKLMGDGKPGMAGMNATEVISNATMVKQSLEKTERLASLLGIHPGHVAEAVFLIQSYEPEDGSIWLEMRG